MSAASERPAPVRWIDRSDRPALPPPLERAIHFFETLSPQRLQDVASIYAPEARFLDPFNDLRGQQAIAGVFAHMFEQLEDPRFAVREAFGDTHQAFVTWDFDFGSGRGPRRRIHGSTHFRFAADGRIDLHRDYWDAAGELYETLPLLGAVLRWLRRRLATPASHAGH